MTVVPSVSVVIPAYNARPFLADALASLGSQTHPPAEVIVVDDGSTDDTAALAASHPACTTCLRQRNRGVTAARNLGAQHARGQLLAFLDADDAWLPRRLELTTKRLACERADAVLCAAWETDDAFRRLGCLSLTPKISPERMLLSDASVVSSSSNLLIARGAFDAVGGFDETLSTSADWYLTFRILDTLRWGYEPEPLVLYRRRDGSMSSNIDQMAREMSAIYDRIFAHASPDRRRLRRRALGALHRTLAGSYFVERDPARFVRHMLMSVVLSPSELSYFASSALRQARDR